MAFDKLSSKREQDDVYSCLDTDTQPAVGIAGNSICFVHDSGGDLVRIDRFSGVAWYKVAEIVDGVLSTSITSVTTPTVGTNAQMDDYLTSIAGSEAEHVNEVWVTTDAPIGQWSLRLIDGVWKFYPDAVVDENGNIRTTDSPPTRQELVDNTGTYLYEGYAPFGTLTSAAGWTIYRHTLSAGGISSSGASDNNPAAEWDERAGTETYTDD